MAIEFSNVLLEDEQKRLLTVLVEASRNVPRDQRRRFTFIEFTGGAFLRHPGLAKKDYDVYKGDLEVLINERLILPSYSSKDTLSFDVSPVGFRYYEYLKSELGQPVKQLETSIRDYIDADDFKKKHPNAYHKWLEADSLLWASDSENQLTLIGHLCREAAQEFASSLISLHRPPDPDPDKAHTIARLRAVLEHKGSSLSDSVCNLLGVQLKYWGTVTDLIQRQEHGAQKEGRPLLWEDGRRVVFHTAMVMFEMDRTLSLAR